LNCHHIAHTAPISSYIQCVFVQTVVHIHSFQIPASIQNFSWKTHKEENSEHLGIKMGLTV